WPSYDTGFLSNDIVTIDGRPVFSIRSAASKASPSQEKVSAITKSGDSRSWAASCSSNRPRTLSVEALSLGSYIQVRLRFAATRARDPATSRARRTAARLISPTRRSEERRVGKEWSARGGPDGMGGGSGAPWAGSA